jgi:hypothetical protein
MMPLFAAFSEEFQFRCQYFIIFSSFYINLSLNISIFFILILCLKQLIFKLSIVELQKVKEVNCLLYHYFFILYISLFCI